MTSYVLEAHEKRNLNAIPDAWRTDPCCVFCKIIHGQGPAYKIYEDDMVIAILGPVVSSLSETAQSTLMSQNAPALRPKLCHLHLYICVVHP